MEFGPGVHGMLEKEEEVQGGTDRRAAMKALVDNGRDVFVQRGYHATRVDDLAAAAGVSHGVFYRYFENKDQLAIVLTVQAMRAVADTFVEIPDVTTSNSADLRRWLRRYNTAQSGEAAMIRVWVDAAQEDARLRSLSASALDWGRRRMVRILAGRGFGDIDLDAVVLVALLGGSGPSSAARPPSTPPPRSSNVGSWAAGARRRARPVRGRGGCPPPFITAGQLTFRPPCRASPASLVSVSTSTSEMPPAARRPVRRGPQECSNS